jgi:regulator of replication initiation timing
VDKKDIFVQMERMEEQMGLTFADLSALKQRLVELIEENNRLVHANRQLRKLLKHGTIAEETEFELSKETTVIGEGYDNLARLYNEGFHICNIYYGHLRTEGDCLFCLSFLNK